jgi:small subunit ribosomal protein S1
MESETRNETGASPEPEKNPTPAGKPKHAPRAHEHEDVDPEEAENTAATDREMEEFLAHLDQHLPKEGEEFSGEIIEVSVVRISEEGVLVDSGGKAEAYIPLEEFVRVADKLLVEPGQKIPVIQAGRMANGDPRYSHREARHRLAQDVVQKAFNDKRALSGRVISIVKGGIMLDVGLPSFMPASQIDLFKIPNLDSLLNTEMEAYVIEYDPRRRRAVLSRRQLLFERRESERRGLLSKLTVGSTVTGKVKSALDFGVFVDLGGVDGFVPREEVSYDRGTPPSRIVNVADPITVVVSKVDLDSGKITLSRKRALPDPWDTIDDRYKLGDCIHGMVVSIQNYGAFIHLEEGVTGMIHASDMSWSLGNKKPTDYVRAGESVTAQVLEIDKEKRRISLGLKQVMGDPWAEVEKKYSNGSKVKGVVTSLTNYGAFIKIDETLEGMIHVSDIVWERRLNHPKEVLKVGEEVEAVVLKADATNRRLSLGIKQLQASPYDAYQTANPQGSIVSGKVTRFAPFGAFVELSDGLEGLIHISQIDTARVELPEKALTLGETIKVKILKYEPKNRKISLSRKDALRQVEREEMKQYTAKGNKEAKTFNTFGDALREARKE